MKLTKVTIKNYKSIDTLEINFNEDKTNNGLYGFLGLNESGKSNVLKAISMKDYLSEFNYADFINHEKPDENIEVIYNFLIDLDNKAIKKLLVNSRSIEVPKEFLEKIKIKGVTITSRIEKGKAPINYVDFELGNEKLEGWGKDSINLIKKSTSSSINDANEAVPSILNLSEFLKDNISDVIIAQSPKMIFWKSEDRYLMNNKINLNNFKTNPIGNSIPLKNCFMLADIKEENIPETITSILSDSIVQKNFIAKLDLKVTQFVNKVWSEHDVDVGFAIQSDLIQFTVKDKKGFHQKISDRSDGFRQFISFLLSSSAEVKTGQLENSILLIDEPETHLHPTAQEYLKNEFKKISENNIVMFATHSSYLIDKENFSNYFRIIKNAKLYTELERFENNSTTFSEINYVVFKIPTTDYHNELYDWCWYNQKTDLTGLNKDLKYYNDGKKSEEQVSLSTYVRHQIHHPGNEKNKLYTIPQLKKSIEVLREIKYGA